MSISVNKICIKGFIGIVGKLILAVVLCLSWNGMSAMSPESPTPDDSIVSESAKGYVPSTRFQIAMGKITASKPFKMTYIGVPAIAVGLALKKEDKDFRAHRNSFMPEFHVRHDDVLQYLPGMVMLGMKIGGVESRSSWGRMLVSDAFSAVLMAGVVNTIKHKAGVWRPDGSNRRSFPSGHTATVFMMATMLSKEYGHKSPWISVGAYTVAAATGLSRIANNRHWMSDVMVGAGIGILSTEIGYYLADLIFKDKGIRRFDEDEYYDRWHHPSFVGAYTGITLTPGVYDLVDGTKIDFSTGASLGLEGAWFANPYVGIGGMAGASNMGLLKNGEALEERLTIAMAAAGAYFSYPVTPRVLLGGKVLGGYGRYKTAHLPADMKFGGNGSAAAVAGLSTTFRAASKFNVNLHCDYSLLPGPHSMKRRSLHGVTIGTSMSVAF